MDQIVVFIDRAGIIFCDWLSSHLVELDPVLVLRTGGVIRRMKFNKRVLGFKETKCNKTLAVEYYSFDGHKEEMHVSRVDYFHVYWCVVFKENPDV